MTLKDLVDKMVDREAGCNKLKSREQVQNEMGCLGVPFWMIL